jgi:hypothetical protein
MIWLGDLIMKRDLKFSRFLPDFFHESNKYVHKRELLI